MNRCAVFSCIGLGDGLITLVLSHNLQKGGYLVDTYHPFMSSMQELFPMLPLLKRPEEGSFDFLNQYDKLYIFYEKTSWMESLLKHALTFFPEKTVVLNPIATPHKDYPFWEQGEFDGNLPFVDNLVVFCREKIAIKDASKENGIQLSPKEARVAKRVILHPTSSRAGKNWSKGKFLSLAKRLAKEGFEPVFILTQEEQKLWPEVQAPLFNNLKELTYFIAHSGYMIGNDSGIGHLASCLGLPTLIICRSEMSANFWRPAWTKGAVLFPPHWIPNVKGFRYRDQKWQAFISVRKVFKKFLSLC